MPKLSRFNHFQLREDGNYIAYNAFSGAVALMTAENYTIYGWIVEKLTGDPNMELNEKEKELLKQLEYGNFMAPDDLDELESMKFRHNWARYDQTTLGLVIAPTMACNMDCEYCYEENKSGNMSPEIMDALVDFVDKRGPNLRSFSAGWYGGEPLLAMATIGSLTKRFMELGEKHNFDYGASIISNGVLLTPETTDKLVEYKVRNIQVTVDGPGRIHNIKRPLKNGKPSFDTIMKNVAYAADKLTVSIRVNIDKSFDREIVGELLKELVDAGLHEKVALYFGLLEPATQVCSNISESCYETADFSKVEIDYYRMLLQSGFGITRLPSPTITFCMAQVCNSFLIDPAGEIYRCFNHVGNPDKTMGNIRDDIDYQHRNFRHLFAFEPFSNEHCRACSLMPTCMGGCPSRRADRNLTGDQMCETWKHNLEPMLEIIAVSKQREQLKKAEKEKLEKQEAAVATGENK